MNALERKFGTYGTKYVPTERKWLH